jgi:hypothetical protein
MRLAGACRSTWELPLGCCGGVWRWAVGVCWRSCSGKVDIEEQRSPEKTCVLRVLDVAAIIDTEYERLTTGGLSCRTETQGSHSALLGARYFSSCPSQPAYVWRTKTVVAGALVGSCGKKFRATLPPVRRLTHAGSRALRMIGDYELPSRGLASPTTLIALLVSMPFASGVDISM